jgi:hypothetical protein
MRFMKITLGTLDPPNSSLWRDLGADSYAAALYERGEAFQWPSGQKRDRCYEVGVETAILAEARAFVRSGRVEWLAP